MILLMFSGGLDSTGVFYKLIKEKHNLHVHHMNLINIENRNEAESIAVRNICDYMKKIGDPLEDSAIPRPVPWVVCVLIF